MEKQIGTDFLKYQLQDWIYPEIEFEVSKNDLIVLLLKLDRTKMPPEVGRRNLIGVDKNGKIIWIAPLPKSYSLYGSYREVNVKEDTIEAFCGSTLCEISLKTGKILSERFIK
jgi:hypothetical protein